MYGLGDQFKLIEFANVKQGEKLLNEYVAYGQWKLFDVKLHGAGGVLVLEKIKNC